MTKKEKLLASAQKLLLKGQVPKAIKEYEQIVQLEPNDLRMRLKLAELYSRAKMLLQAIEEYRKIGTYYTDNGFYLKAIAVFKQAQRIDPANPELYVKLAELNIKQGLVGNALAEYRTLVSFYENQKNPDEVIRILQKMQDLEPENLNIRVKLAEAYAKQNRKSEALDNFKEVLGILQGKNDHLKINKLCEIFSGFFPQEPVLKEALGQSLVQKGEYAQGLALLLPLLEQDADNAGIAKSVAYACFKTGKHAKAHDLYTILLDRTPGDLDLRELQIRVGLAAGEYSRTLKILEDSKSAFFEADRISGLKNFYEVLRQHLPGEERIVATLHTISAVSAEVDGALLGEAPEVVVAHDPLVLDSTTVPDDQEVATEPSANLSATDEQDEDFEEIPLEFLEGVHGTQEVVPAALPEEPAEETLELDLDFSGAVAEISDEPTVLELVDDELSLSFDDDEGFTPSGLDGLPDYGEEVPAEPLAARDVSEVTARIEEAGFYLTQGLFDEAKKVCSLLLQTSPDCGEAKELLREIESRQMQQEVLPSGEQTDFSDFAEAILDEIDSFDLPTQAEGELKESFVADADYPKSNKGVEEQIDAEDSESYYNLGIAYREMGLLNEAINAFNHSMKDNRRRVDSLTLKGGCLVDKKDYAEAEVAFKLGLRTPELSDNQKVNLFYEMGLLYELWSRPLDALDSFQNTSDIDPFFRNVQDRIHQLKSRLGMQEGDDPLPKSGKGGKDRVSYV